MITVTPIEDNMRKEALLKSTNISLNSGNILVLQDNGQELGHMVIDLDQSILRMQSLHLHQNSLEALDEQAKLYVDFMVRSAASYGANHGAYHLENHIAQLHDFLITKGFSTEHGVCTIKISSMVHACKLNCK